MENCHKGYGWTDIDRVYSVVGKDQLATYRKRHVLFDSVFALVFGIATVITAVWAFEDGCRTIGERWFALSLIVIGLAAMIFNWLENSALSRTALAWIDAVEGRHTDLHASLARTASRRTVTKMWLFRAGSAAMPLVPCDRMVSRIRGANFAVLRPRLPVSCSASRMLTCRSAPNIPSSRARNPLLQYQVLEAARIGTHMNAAG